MSQPSETIRPRHRRRLWSPPANLAASRAEQSTRILIQVPWISPEAAAAVRRVAGGSTPSTRPATKPTDETTLGIATGSSPIDGAEKTAAPSSPAVAKVLATLPQNPARTVRIDTGHAESISPHSASSGWMSPPSGWLPRMLQRNSLLATAAIVVVVTLVLVRLNHRNVRSDSAEKSTAPIGAASIVEQNSDPTRPASAKRPLESSANSQSSAERSASQRSRNMPKLPAGNPTAGDSAAPLLNSGHLKGVRSPSENESLPGPAGWNLPAATNAPAAIEALAPSQNADQFKGASTTVTPPYYNARRDVPSPVDTIILDRAIIERGAAFTGGIEKTPLEVSR